MNDGITENADGTFSIDLSWLDSDPDIIAMRRKEARVERVFGWTKRIPYVGGLVHTFWFCLFIEGPYQTMEPRWGTLTFAFLNDGQGATLWHTWRSITHDGNDPYTGIYIDGAPNSLKEAEEMERRWADERARKHQP